MDFIRELRSNVVQLVAALILVVGGVALTIQGTNSDPADGFLLVLGGISTAFGGVLVSWEAGKVVSRREAMDDVRSQLDLVSRSLGQAAGQIIRAVEQTDVRAIHVATGLAVIQQSTSVIYAQVNAIQNILGDRFDAADLLETAQKLDTLASKLAREGEDTTTVRREIGKLVTELSDRSPTARGTADVSCPYCGHDTSVTIGVNGGDTAVKTCEQCHRRFNNHRRVDGSVFTREIARFDSSQKSDLQSPRRQREMVSFVCECGHANSLERFVGEEKDAVCPECGQVLILSAAGEAEPTDRKYRIVDSLPTGREGSGGTGARPVTRCPSCDRSLRCIISEENRYSAIDDDCGLVLRVAHEEFMRWRSSNEPETIHPAAIR